MCGRASITKTEKVVEDRFGSVFAKGADGTTGYAMSTNICPTEPIAVITNTQPQSIKMYRWGLIPPWAKDVRIGYKTFNARAETLLQKPAFKTAAEHRRCLVLMDSFYEWKDNNGRKLPYRISLDGSSLFAVAGLWDTWHDPVTGINVHSCTVITHEPNTFMSSIHDRMPAILAADQERLWIDAQLPTSAAMELLQPMEGLQLIAEQIDPLTGRADDRPTQLSLF